MATAEKVRMVLGLIAAIGLCGVCGAVYGNEALPMWARLLADALALVNVICVVRDAQEKVKKGKQ